MYPLALNSHFTRHRISRPARLVFTEKQWAEFRSHLIQKDGSERAAFMLLGRYRGAVETKYLVHKLLLVPDDRCVQQHGAVVEPEIECVLENLLKYTQGECAAFLHAHSHPFTRVAYFSSIDDAYLPREIESLKNYLQLRKSDRPCRFARIVIGQDEAGFSGEVYDDSGQEEEQFIGITVVGESGVRDINHSQANRFGTSDVDSQMGESDIERLNRNINWLGKAGQSILTRTRVAICGLGGLGAEMLLNLRGLGVRRFTLIDMDRIEKTNLNRLPWGLRSIGRYKAEVARAFVHSAVPDAEVEVITAPVEDEQSRTALNTVDFIIAAVDDNNARLNVQVLAARHMIPLLDLGAGISLTSGNREAERMGGQARLYVPDGACLLCQGLDPNRIVPREIRELHRQIGYVEGTEETPTSVVTINATLAGIASQVFLNYVTGFCKAAQWTGYDALAQSITTMKFEKRSDCPVCGDCGIEGLGEDLVKPIAPTSAREAQRIESAPKLTDEANVANVETGSDCRAIRTLNTPDFSGTLMPRQSNSSVSVPE